MKPQQQMMFKRADKKATKLSKTDKVANAVKKMHDTQKRNAAAQKEAVVAS